MKLSSTKGGPYLALVGGLGVSTVPQAAGTITIDDERSVSIGGARLQIQI